MYTYISVHLFCNIIVQQHDMMPMCNDFVIVGARCPLCLSPIHLDVCRSPFPLKHLYKAFSCRFSFHRWPLCRWCGGVVIVIMPLHTNYPNESYWSGGMLDFGKDEIPFSWLQRHGTEMCTEFLRKLPMTLSFRWYIIFRKVSDTHRTLALLYTLFIDSVLVWCE